MNIIIALFWIAVYGFSLYLTYSVIFCIPDLLSSSDRIVEPRNGDKCIFKDI